jgi:23S rRNA (uridine2552-2'-O)-methyltransferase
MVFCIFAGVSLVFDRWLERQRKDPYVRKAIKETYRARSAFKLIEIDDKYKILNSGSVVVDIGASPGSWSQVATRRTNSDGLGETEGSLVVVDF